MNKIRPTGLPLLALLGGLGVLTACGDGLDAASALKDGPGGLPVLPGSPVFYESLVKKSSHPSNLRSILLSPGQGLLASNAAGGWNLVGSEDSLNLAPNGDVFDLTDVEGFHWADVGGKEGADGSYLSDRRLYYKGVRIEGVQLKQELLALRPTWIQGTIPAWFVENSLTSEFKVEEFSISEDQAREKAASYLGFHPWLVRGGEKLFLSSPERLVSTFEFTVASSEDASMRGPAVPLRIIVNASTGELISQSPLAFHVNGSATMYMENKEASKDTGLEDITLPSLKDDGSKLANDLFSVVSCMQQEPSAACTFHATSSNGDFRSIDYNNTKYDEIVAYHAISRSKDWHLSILGSMSNGTQGKNWGSLKTSLGLSAENHLKVFVRALTKTQSGETTRDNAQYLPKGRSGAGTPEILIGTGWEADQGKQRYLIYLGRDADVTMHEFGHHIVFRGLKDISGQSGAMHEGFSDYFTYAITGNNKLGESIVATGAALRQGSIPGVIKNFLNAGPHKAGEFWSSALWDVRVALGDWKDGFAVADKVIWDAIDLIKEDAKYYDAISALAKSAEAFSAATGQDAVAMKNKMFDVFYNRGFLQQPDGSGNLPQQSLELGLSNTTSNISSETKSTSTASKKTSSGWCGVVAGTHGNSGSKAGLWLVALTLLLPLTARLKLKIPQSLRVKTKHRNR